MSFYIVGATFILFVIVELLRRNLIREKYATVWFFISGLLFLASIWPAPVFKISKLLGFTTPSNFVFSILILLLLILMIQLSAALGQLESKTQALADEVALLKVNNNSKNDTQ